MENRLLQVYDYTLHNSLLLGLEHFAVFRQALSLGRDQEQYLAEAEEMLLTWQCESEYYLQFFVWFGEYVHLIQIPNQNVLKSSELPCSLSLVPQSH